MVVDGDIGVECLQRILGRRGLGVEVVGVIKAGDDMVVCGWWRVKVGLLVGEYVMELDGCFGFGLIWGAYHLIWFYMVYG